MDRIITLLVTMTVALAIGAGGVWVYDRHPPIGFDVPWPASWVLRTRRIEAPDSLATRMAQAEALAAARKGELDRLARAGAAATEEASAGIAMAQPEIRAHQAIAAGLRDFVPAGADELTRWRSADAEVLEELR